jgi:hypothetical protein
LIGEELFVISNQSCNRDPRSISCSFAVPSLCSFWIWLHKQVPVWEHWNAAEAGARRFSWNRDCILCGSLNSAFLFLPFRTDAVTSNKFPNEIGCVTLNVRPNPGRQFFLKDLYDNVVFNRCRRRLSYMREWTSSSWAMCQANPTYCKRTYLQMELEAERSVSILVRPNCRFPHVLWFVE